MKKKLLLTAVILGGVVVLPIRAMDTTPAVTIYMDYDPSIPTFVVRLAKRQASRIFAKIGTPVQFRYGRKAQTVGQSSLELDMYIVMQAPARIPSDTFGISQPYRQGGRIEVFYSRIQNYTPELSRSMVLAYIMAHEIGHVLEGVSRHAVAGVMKAKWNDEDVEKICAGTLEFDTIDVELIRLGTEKRVNDANIAHTNSVSKMVR